MDHQSLFNEPYRVIAVDDSSLVVRGTRTGELLTIRNAGPEIPFNVDDSAVGRLISLSDPSVEPVN